MLSSLHWRHNGHDSVSNHQPRHCLLNRLFGRRSKKTSKLRVTGLCAGNSPGTGECGEFTGDRWIPTQRASNAENVSIWWRHHVSIILLSRYAMVNFLPNPHNRHPIARPWCLFCEFIFRFRGYPAKRALSAMRKHGGYGPFGRIPSIYVLPQSLQLFMWYHITFDRVIAAAYCR